MSDTRLHISEFRSGVAHPLDRLQEVTEELIGLHRRLALLLESEVRGKAKSYMESQEPSVSGKEREGSVLMAGTTADIILLKGEIAAYTEERDYLRILVGHA